jgi:hypothetical protein
MPRATIAIATGRLDPGNRWQQLLRDHQHRNNRHPSHAHNAERQQDHHECDGRARHSRVRTRIRNGRWRGSADDSRGSPYRGLPRRNTEVTRNARGSEWAPPPRRCVGCRRCRPVSQLTPAREDRVLVRPVAVESRRQQLESFAIDANHAGIVWMYASCRSPSAGVMAARSAPRTSSKMAAAWSKRSGDPTLSRVTEQLRSVR